MQLREKLLSTEYFIQNEYFEKYFKLIQSNRHTVTEKFKTNKHHIIPVHYFINKGETVDNSKHNIVILSFKDHLLAHLYLSGCTKGRYRYWNLYSVFMLSGRTFSPEDERAVVDICQRDDYNKLYEEAISSAPNHRKGTKVSEETRLKMAAAQQERAKEHGSPTKGTRWVHNSEKDYMVPEEELDLYIQDGFELGRLFRHSEEEKRKCALASETRKKNDGYTSPEYRKKLSDANRGNTHSRESIERQKKSIKEYYKTHPGTFLNRKHSEESNAKNREAHIGKITINREGVIKMIRPENLDEYLQDGWSQGRK